MPQNIAGVVTGQTHPAPWGGVPGGTGLKGGPGQVEGGLVRACGLPARGDGGRKTPACQTYFLWVETPAPGPESAPFRSLGQNIRRGKERGSPARREATLKGVRPR